MNLQPSASNSAPLIEKPENRPRINSEQLLGGATIVEIEHAGQCYLLRVTRENKLILTK